MSNKIKKFDFEYFEKNIRKGFIQSNIAIHERYFPRIEYWENNGDLAKWIIFEKIYQYGQIHS